jgi:SAM-dependent methyltransferase
MSREDRERWDRRYATAHGPHRPARFLAEIFSADAWPVAGGRALDLASGSGRNALFLAERGFAVLAIDVSAAALEQGRRRAEEKHLVIEWQQADLEKVQLPEASFNLVVNFNYLQRSLFPQIKSALTVGGYAVFETYLIDQQALGHPKNPAYLLRHNELLEVFAGFRVLWYREGRFSDNGDPAFRAGIFAQKCS